MDYATNEHTGLPLLAGVGVESRGDCARLTGAGGPAASPLPLPLAGERDRRTSDSAASVAASLLRGIVSGVPGVFAITARGHSMLDAMVSDGDVVMLQQSAALRDGEQAAVRVSGGPIKLRRVHRKGDRVALQPNNPRMPLESVASHELEVLGRVVAIVRQDPRKRGASGRGSTESPTRAA
jgi:repressor LexA